MSYRRLSRCRSLLFDSLLNALFDVAPLESVHVIVTDQGVQPEVVEQFQQGGFPGLPASG